ncbi:MAG: hypothetical protein A2015_05450 [Spirochaetes bacterium GWF1_31_7]|nr:MAG: hypothetical protein A2Y30_04760 [Spirochaetes bacterium GWE1_32_154]OHD47809.1 MAG: hypothetical protein A2Y29_09510 [Spirochaetes bacterium GWE2_31_10]OHD52537.1 MAG: hypothetical protein A2015_05450 [Spirochaetes bacterium GWF1_31_7]OHD80740.1 MAG: hypothetical protein A2355_17465 [Spirochaetes bacterium RIFOXYB1_FULL_32_8]HBD93412.1 hypothetical protein [Spirochaetia bacterium]
MENKYHFIANEIKRNLENINKITDMLHDQEPALYTTYSHTVPITKTNAFNINLSLDDVDDIFDDFDDNPEIIETRTISDDFIDAIKVRYRHSIKELYIHMIFPVFFKNYVDEKTIIATLQQQIHLKRKVFNVSLIYKLILVISYLIIGVASLVNIQQIERMLGLFFNMQNRGYGELIMILGWVGMWEGITRTVDFCTNDLKKIIFWNKLDKATFAFIYK